MNAKLSIYNGVKDTQGVDTTFAEVRSRIKHGGRGLAEKTKLLNVLYQTDPEAYTKEKAKLPAVTWSGTFLAGKRLGKGLLQHSGYVVLDVDNDIDMGTVLADFAQHPNVALAFVSPSGTGVKPVIPISPIPTTPAEHKHAFDAVLEVFHEYAEQDPKELPKQRDVNRLCLLAYDPKLVENPNATPIEWDPEDVYEPETDTERVAVEIDEDSEGFLKKHGIVFDADGASQYLPKSHCQRTQHKSNNNAVRYFKNSDGSLNGYCNGCRESWYLVPPKIRKPVKLKDVKPFEGVLDTLDKARSFLKNVFAKGAQFFAIRTDTGTGKTENAITYAVSKDVVIPTQSGKLRDEIVSRATDKEMFAWGYRGINETETADGYMPCIQPERFDLFRLKGFNPYKWICETCPAYHECKERGYLSQPDRAKASQLLAIPFPTAFLDGRLRNWAKMYLPKEGLILHDDLPIGSLFIEYQLTADRLRRILTDWEGTVAVEWAEILLSCFILRDWEKMRTASELLTATEYNTVVQAFTRCKLPETGAIVDADTLIRSQLVDYSTTDAIAKLPTLDAEKFDTASMLELFWERYPRIEDAPFFYNAATETFTFTFLPKPYRSKKVRVGFAGATMHKELMTRILPGIEFYDANTTAWQQGAEVYQLRTNRNPRGTVLNAVEKYLPSGEKVWEWDGLNATGDSYYGKVLSFIKSTPNETHAVFSFKNVIEEKQSELDALGVVSGWFGNLAGLDKAFEGVKNFHILFCPFVKPSDVDFLCKQLFGNDATPLKRDEDGNLARNADGTYTDTRAQQVNDVLVVGELLQDHGRARLNLYPNRVFLWTSLFIESVTNRAETVLFDEVDWAAADGDLIKLREIVDAREAGDTKAMAELTGQSDRNARRQTADVRKQTKAEQKQQALTMYADGKSYREIGKVLDKAPNTIKNWCQSVDF